MFAPPTPVSDSRWTSDDDYVLTDVINFGTDDAIVHLDPDQTFASWAAGLSTVPLTDFVLYTKGSPAGVMPFQLKANQQILKGQLIILSSANTTLLQLFLLGKSDLPTL
jgi:hypothetical protein